MHRKKKIKRIARKEFLITDICFEKDIGLPIIDENQCIKFSSCTTLQKFYIKSQGSQNNCDKNRFLVRGNTRKILAEFWHLFWLKMIVKIEIQRWPAEIPVNLLGQFSLSGQIFFSWAAAARNFEIFLSRPLFTIIFKPKMVSNLCVFFVYCLAPETYSG